MKRARSKFGVKPILQGGGLTGFLGKNLSGTSGMTVGQGIGAATSMLTGLFPQGPSKITDVENPYATEAADKYNSVLDKNQKVKGTLKSLGSMGLQSGNPFGMIGGAVLTGASLLPFGAKKEKKAKADYNSMVQAGKQSDMANAGAINYNSRNSGYHAPAYGKKGLKFKTKFSKA
jgi:hypothetical protein